MPNLKPNHIQTKISSILKSISNIFVNKPFYFVFFAVKRNVIEKRSAMNTFIISIEIPCL